MTIDWAAPPAPALIVLAGIVLCWVLPGAVRLVGSPGHPVAVASSAMGWAARKLNRARRSVPDRAARGFLVTALFVGLAAWAGWAVERRVDTLRYVWLAELVLVVLLIDPRGVAARARGAARLLERDRPAAASRLGVGDGAPMLAEAEPFAAARVAAERVARDSAADFVTPLFWYLVLGPPGLLAARGAREAAHRMAGSAPSRHAFGTAAGGLDTALGLIPGWLTAIALCLAAAFVPGARPVAAAAGLTAGGTAGAPAGALAGALGLSLGGPCRLRLGDERWREERPWIGGGRARVTPADLRRAAWFPAILTLFAIAGLAAALRPAG